MIALSFARWVSAVRSQRWAAGYYLVMAVVVTAFIGLWLFEGYFLFTAWFPSLYDELTPINGVAAGAFMTLMLGCALAALVRPNRAIGTSKVLVVGAGLLALSTIVTLAVLASVDGAHRQTLVAATVFLAAMLGLVSVVYPDELHSLGVAGGTLVLAWCLAVALAWLRSGEHL